MREGQVFGPKLIPLFWVEDVPSPRPEIDPEGMNKGNIGEFGEKEVGARALRRSWDGRKITREHKVWVKL